jgi:malonyl-CoA/methylmalonyl-CoA synthetase
MLFTSGTTGNKKGVLHNWRSLETQMDSLTQAWEWSSSDKILSFLPLNHIHGVMNILNTALYNGA